MDQITPEEWERVQDLLDEILPLPADDRAEAIVRSCHGDDRLRGLVEEFVAVADTPFPLLDGSVDDYTVLLADDVEDATGRRFGPFEVTERIGQGGMGAVWLAQRVDGQFEQRVAIKQIRPGFEPAFAESRFREERRILARLDHPGIARLLDAGVAEHGQPFLAMEYVRGASITRFCDERGLSIEQRLRIILPVCDAVEHAHRNLVVHRDLKPANIHVTDEGSVKLLDFGIAGLLGEPEQTAASASVRVMTPPYASPEQMRGEAVSTATDVYSLGVVLYELLSGVRPFDLDGLDARAIESLICERVPAPPSQAAGAAAGGNGEAAAAVRAEVRATTPSKLRRQLAGDLDAIVLRALAKDPAQRYPSVAALAHDLRRHLESLPVDARRSSLAYRAGRFTRRHRLPLGAAALLAMALVAGLVGTSSQARRAGREATHARQVRDFLLNTFKSADPDVTDGGDVTARQLLDEGARRARSELTGQPALLAEMLLVIADVYQSLGLHREGMPLADEAVGLLVGVYGEAHADVATARNAAAWLHYHEGDYELAERELRAVIELRRRLLGTRHPELARSLDNLAETLRQRGEFAEAEQLAREALAMRSELLGRHADVATSLNNLAVIVRQTGSRDEAESLYRQALALDSALKGPDHRDVLTDFNNLANLLREKGQMEEAETIFRTILMRQRSRYGEDHPVTTTTRNNLAAVLSSRGRPAEAEVLFREVLGTWERRGEPEHPNAVSTHISLAQVLQQQSRLEEAQSVLRHAVALARRRFGDAHPLTAYALNNLASALFAGGDIRRAEPIFLQAIDIGGRLWSPDHPIVATFELGYARLLERDGRCPRAVALLDPAIARFGAGEVVPGSAAEARIILGSCLTSMGRPRDAEPHLLEAHRALAGNPARQRVAADRLIAVYEALGRPELGRPYR